MKSKKDKSIEILQLEVDILRSLLLRTVLNANVGPTIKQLDPKLATELKDWGIAL